MLHALLVNAPREFYGVRHIFRSSYQRGGQERRDKRQKLYKRQNSKLQFFYFSASSETFLYDREMNVKC